MREVLYIQAGEISNYTGTHFWNTQETYLNDGEDGDSEESIIDPNISFCETADAQGIVSLYPRVLVIDRNSKFGRLRSSQTCEGDTSAVLWNGKVVEHRQEPIQPSRYQTLVEEASEQTAKHPARSPAEIDVRYWSDFGRPSYLPRSLQRIPDSSVWGNGSVNWNDGPEFFSRYNEEFELMDSAVRLLIEDCDNIQGIQVLNDASTFGSYMGSFFVSFRDEYLKLPSLSFPLGVGGISKSLDIENAESTRKFLNEALYLSALNELSSMNIPINDPASWRGPRGWPTKSKYHQSAILSTHIETVTLPLRLRNAPEDISSACRQLKWRTSTPFGELSGVFPVSSISDLDGAVHNFSIDTPGQSSTVYTRWDVTRGLSPRQIGAYEEWIEKKRTATGPYTKSTHSFAYPLPSSFPPLTSEEDQYLLSSSNPISTQVLSTLSTSSNTANLLEGYALFVEKCLKTRTSVVISAGTSFDDLKELANNLWTMHDNSSGLEELGDI
ncbi:unnamed protein product [Cyclocybe aegerita]|uniref:Tubulin nucleotide-binding domain-like protein n=1 Tax=Cyclocybe aegerita TaxID=1973307 RepID=A0A8S0VZP3_CYCAE|nr:unnamed protein product [Cyclocybe aegerita]